MDQVQAVQVQPGMTRTSWRIRFAYRGDEVWPIAAARVGMVAPGGIALPRDANLSGAWIEVVGGERGERWVRSIQQPNRADREAFLEDGGITRVKRDPEGEFEVVIPDLGPAATFFLHASPSAAPERAAERRLALGIADLLKLERESASSNKLRGDKPDQRPPRP